MNTTLGELLLDLNNRISAAKVSGFWTDAMKKEWLNTSGQRVCDWYKWKDIELALETVSRDGKEYYDYPTAPNEFKKDSIYYLSIEGETYPPDRPGRSRLNWDEYQRKKAEESDDLIFTNHNGFYFLNPVPQDGKIISIFGLKKWRKLEEDDDESILSSEFDEAIIRIALATCMRKAKRYNEAKAELVEVLDPQVGVLAMIKSQMENEAPQGYAGEAQSSRWN
jgi:hypothetical protein